MTLGQRVKCIRTDLGMSQSELANCIGITQSQICKIETDKAKPSLDVLMSISKVLQCDVDFLIAKEVSV